MLIFKGYTSVYLELIEKKWMLHILLKLKVNNTDPFLYLKSKNK